MNPDVSRWLFLWIVLCTAFYFFVGFFFSLDLLPRVLITTNFVTFVLVLLDKIAASMRMRRIPEVVLYAATFFGGSIGMLFGMFLIRHKSRKVAFQFVVGLLVLVQVALLVWYFGGLSGEWLVGSGEY